jgi:hypothetical protein
LPQAAGSSLSWGLRPTKSGQAETKIYLASGRSQIGRLQKMRRHIIARGVLADEHRHLDALSLV